MSKSVEYHDLSEVLGEYDLKLHELGSLPQRLSRFLSFDIAYQSKGEIYKQTTLAIYLNQKYMGGIDLIKTWYPVTRTICRVFGAKAIEHKGTVQWDSSHNVSPFEDGDGNFHRTFETLPEMFLDYFHAELWNVKDDKVVRGILVLGRDN